MLAQNHSPNSTLILYSDESAPSRTAWTSSKFCTREPNHSLQKFCLSGFCRQSWTRPDLDRCKASFARSVEAGEGIQESQGCWLEQTEFIELNRKMKQKKMCFCQFDLFEFCRQSWTHSDLDRCETSIAQSAEAGGGVYESQGRKFDQYEFTEFNRKMNKIKCVYVNSTCSSFAGNPGLTRTSIDAKQVSHNRRKRGKGFRKVRLQILTI